MAEKQAVERLKYALLMDSSTSPTVSIPRDLLTEIVDDLAAKELQPASSGKWRVELLTGFLPSVYEGQDFKFDMHCCTPEEAARVVALLNQPRVTLTLPMERRREMAERIAALASMIAHGLHHSGPCGKCSTTRESFCFELRAIAKELRDAR